jgi:hypothetical protein
MTKSLQTLGKFASFFAGKLLTGTNPVSKLCSQVKLWVTKHGQRRLRLNHFEKLSQRFAKY